MSAIRAVARRELRRSLHTPSASPPRAFPPEITYTGRSSDVLGSEYVVSVTNGLHSMGDGFAIIRALEENYGEVSEFHLPRGRLMSTYLATFFVRFRGDVKDLVGERKHFIVEAPAKSRNSQNHSEGLDNLTGLLSRRNRTSESNVQEKKAENALVLNVKIRRRQKDDAGQSYYLRTVPEPLYRPQKLAAAKELSELEGFSDTTVPEVGATRAYWLKIALGWGIRPAAAPASLRDDAASPSSSSTPPGQLTPATPEPSSSSPSPTPHLGQISHSEAGTPSLSLESRPTNSAVISMDSSSTPGLADEKHGIVSDAAASSALTKKERMLLKAREAARTSILKEKEEQQQSVEDAQKNEALSNKLWRFIVPKKQ